MKPYITILFILVGNICLAQNSIDVSIATLKQKDFSQIYKARDTIFYHSKDAIPKLIELLKDTSCFKLENTADLIFPGAAEFYGHGTSLDYDFDWVAARAGWILEDITFHDFGYQYSTLKKSEFMGLNKYNYETWLFTGEHEKLLKDPILKKKMIAYYLKLADDVAKWWEKNNKSWSRYESLKLALQSKEAATTENALYHLENKWMTGLTLTKENYKNEIKPLVIKISLREDAAAAIAKKILRMENPYTIRMQDRFPGRNPFHAD